MSLPVKVVLPPLVTLWKGHYTLIKQWYQSYNISLTCQSQTTHPPIPIINFILILLWSWSFLTKESLPCECSRECFQSLSPFLPPRISLSLLFHWWTRLSPSLYSRLGFASRRRGSLANKAALGEPISVWSVWLICILAMFHGRTCRAASVSGSLARWGRNEATALQLKSGNIPPNQASEHILCV